MSRYVWKKRDEGQNPKVKWKFLEKNVSDFNPITEICRLCTCEKFQIVLNPNVATLNQKTEIFSQVLTQKIICNGRSPRLVYSTHPQLVFLCQYVISLLDLVYF